MSSIPENIIIKFLQETANPEEIRLFDQWISESAQNRELFYQMMEIWDAREKDLSGEEMTESWGKLYGKVSELPVGKTKNPQSIKPMNPKFMKRHLPQWTRYAAAILIGITASVMWYQLAPDASPLAREPLVQNYMYNQNGVLQLMLPDSSMVWLYAKSSISYPGNFDGDLRKVSLEGEAYFEVRKKPTQPFVVQAANINVRVLGTEFVVKSVAESDIVVALISGSVSVNANDEKGEMIAHATLEPGQQAGINRNNGQIHISDADTPYYIAWKDGSCRFTDEPLEKVMALLSKHYQINIQMSPELKKMHFTGTVIPENNIRDVLEIISITHPIRYRITPEGVSIHTK